MFNCTISTKTLTDALTFLNYVVPNKTIQPILFCVKMEAKDNRLYLEATDLRIGLKLFLEDIQIYEEGNLLIPFKEFYNYIKNLPDEKIDMKLINGKLFVKCKRSKINFPIMKTDDFPILIPIQQNKLFELPVFIFNNLLDKVKFAVSLEENQASSGIHVFSEKNMLIVEATDSYRIAKIKMPVNDLENLNIILPKEIVDNLNKILNNKKIIDKNLYVYFDSNKIMFIIENITIISSLLGSSYLNIEPIINNCKKINKNIAIINRNLLLSILKRINAISATNLMVKMIFSVNTLTILNESICFEGNNIEFQEDIDIEYNGEKLEIKCNGKYLIEHLSSIESEKVKFLLGGRLSPFLITPSDDENYENVIGPIR